MSENTPMTDDAMQALQARFAAQSRKAQTYYTVMHAVTAVLGGEAAASSWMEAPLAAFDGQTPAQLITAGDEQQVLAHIATLAPAGKRSV